MQFPANAPYLLNTIVRRSVLDRIREQFGNACGDLVGDCGFFASVIACDLPWTFIDAPLIVMHSADNGIGASLVAGTRTPAIDSLLTLIATNGGVSQAPIPEIVTNMNIRAHEFISAFKKAGREDDAIIDPASYCASIHSELSIQAVTFPSDAMNRLASFADSHGITLGPRHGHPAKSARRLLRELLDHVPPDILGPIGRRLNLPVARFSSLNNALQYAANTKLSPNSVSVESAFWK